MSGMAWQAAGATHIGLVRTSNQDALLIRNDIGLCVAADGMGGQAGGDVASRLAVDTVQETVEALVTSPTQWQAFLQQPETGLRGMVSAAHAAIRAQALRVPDLHGMGTTFVAAMILGPASSAGGAVAHLIHVGDSRGYLLRQGRLSQLTRDHSFVEDLMRRGLLTAEEALVHPHRHRLTRALGVGLHVEPDYTTQALEPDDLLLLCTDGLTKMLDDRAIETLIGASPADPQRIAQALVDESNDRGGHDNVTVIVCARIRPTTAIPSEPA